MLRMQFRIIHEATKFYSPFNDPATGDLMEYQPFVKEGDLVIFPSYLLHEGPVNKSDKERVIVSFNIMGEPETKAYFLEQIDETYVMQSFLDLLFWNGTWCCSHCRSY